MAKYNMIKHSVFSSTTSGVGSGNKTLTSVELYNLINDQVTVSAVTLSGTDVLCLDVDLTYRLKVDSIILYADDLTKLSAVNFYFKNYLEDSFTICSKSILPTGYTCSLPNPSAPRYIRCTVSGIDINLYEFQILNNDNIVEFGSDGSSTETILNDAPEGVLGEVQSIEIYNNNPGSQPAKAYVCVDYTGSTDDEYVDIAASSDGPFLNITDGEFRDPWLFGTFTNTKKVTLVDSEEVQLTKTINDSTLHPFYIGALPNTSCTYLTAPCGTKKYSTYDHINKRIHVMFWPGTADTSSVIYLYFYNIVTNTWTYRGTLSSALFNVKYISIACDTSKVYIYTATDGNNRTIYEHDLSGALGNFTSRFVLPSSSYSVMNVGMTSDFSGNLYILPIYSTSNSGSRYFARINTTTWTATSLAVYSSADDQTAILNLIYDFERSVIYLLNVDTVWHNGYYIARYNVSDNTWDSQFFNYGTRILANNSNMHFYYYNNSLYFLSDNYGGKIYRYNLVTDAITTIDLKIAFPTSVTNRLVVTEPLDSDYDSSIFILGGIDTARYQLYGYNVPYNILSSNSEVFYTTGTFTSYIYTLDDAFMSSYFTIKNSSLLGATSVSTDKLLHDGLIEIRSSDTPPVPINTIIWGMPYNTSQDISIIKYNLNNNQYTHMWLDGNNNNGYYATSCSVNPRTGHILFAYSISHYQVYSYHYVFDINGTVLRSSSYSRNDKIMSNHWIGKDDDTWYYSNGYLFYGPGIEYQTEFGSLYVPNLYHLAACFMIDTAWYVDRTAKALVKVNRTLDVLYNIYLADPYQVCTNRDDSCWVIDNGDTIYGKTIKKYSIYGVLEKTIQVSNTFKHITSDFLDGFYVLSIDETPQQIHHYDSEGNCTMIVTDLSNITHISGGIQGVLAYESVVSRIQYIERSSKSIVKTIFYTDFGLPASPNKTPPILFSFRIEEQLRYPEAPLYIPQSSEELWASSSNSLPWQVVPKDGYFLPKKKHHQLRVTLRNFDGASTPKLQKIILAPAIVIEDILPQQSKPIFIRSNIPYGSASNTLSARIKVWWDLQDN